jgi:TolB protein
VPAVDPSKPLNVALYKKLGANGVVQITQNGNVLHVVLHDIDRSRSLQTKDFPLAGSALSGDWRMSVHALADVVEEWITGTRGIAASRVAFARDGRLYLVDSDGQNARALGGSGVLSPAWHPNGRFVAYGLMTPAGTVIEVRDLGTGATRRVTPPNGLNATPAVSPDGSTIVFSHGEENGTDLHAVQFGGGSARRVTVGRGTDNVSPSFGPDGRIAFTSGRSGHPEVYITDADGTNAELLTSFAFGDQNYRSDPDWSPDGRAVAFQSRIGGEFQVMTIGLRDRTVKQLTSDGRNEQPSWAPDGRHLVFSSSRSGTKQLWVIDAESGRSRQLTFGASAKQASWSRRLGAAP